MSKEGDYLKCVYLLLYLTHVCGYYCTKLYYSLIRLIHFSLSLLRTMENISIMILMINVNFSYHVIYSNQTHMNTEKGQTKLQIFSDQIPSIGWLTVVIWMILRYIGKLTMDEFSCPMAFEKLSQVVNPLMLCICMVLALFIEIIGCVHSTSHPALVFTAWQKWLMIDFVWIHNEN